MMCSIREENAAKPPYLYSELPVAHKTREHSRGQSQVASTPESTMVLKPLDPRAKRPKGALMAFVLVPTPTVLLLVWCGIRSDTHESYLCGRIKP